MKKTIFKYMMLLTLLVSSNLATGMTINRSGLGRSAGTREYCNVCFDHHEARNFSTLPCGHRNCRATIINQIDTLLNEGRSVLALRCPTPYCNTPLTVENLRAINVDATRLNRLAETLRRVAPAPTTDSAQPCPNALCRVPIEKNEACHHMTCYNCRHEFCWSCLGAWRGANLDHHGVCAERARRYGNLTQAQIRQQEGQQNGNNPIGARPVPGTDRSAQTAYPVYGSSAHQELRRRQAKQIITIIALTAATVALYKYLQTDDEDVKAKNKKKKENKINKEKSETVKA